jgi:hypothetical protein
MTQYKTLREKISAEKAEREARYTLFTELFAVAWEKGRDAARDCRPKPMIVTNDRGDWLDYVDDGVCGFGWVNVPGNTSFGKWLKKTGRGRPDYPTGLSIWISDYGQSYERKAAHASAMASHLQSNGIACRAGSRLD